MKIVEDTATGTPAGPLACQLVKREIVKDSGTITIEQRYEIKSPSLLSVEVRDKVVQPAGYEVTLIEGRR